MADNRKKRGIMRAYKWTLKKETLSNNDDYIQPREFPALLKNLYFFTTLEREFEKADENHDDMVSEEEFKKYLTNMGFQLDDNQLKAEFKKLDEDQSRMAGPLEFFGYCMRALAMTDKDVSTKGDFLNVGYATSSKGRSNDFRGKTHHTTMLSSAHAPHAAYHSQYHHAAPPPAHHPAHHPAVHPAYHPAAAHHYAAPAPHPVAYGAPPAPPAVYHAPQPQPHAYHAGY